jgi:hypothetical protein
MNRHSPPAPVVHCTSSPAPIPLPVSSNTAGPVVVVAATSTTAKAIRVTAPAPDCRSPIIASILFFPPDLMRIGLALARPHRSATNVGAGSLPPSTTTKSGRNLTVPSQGGGLKDPIAPADPDPWHHETMQVAGHRWTGGGDRLLPVRWCRALVGGR